MTLKQELALQKTVENGGNITQAMRDVGYAETTVNNPSNLTQSKGFQELCEYHGLSDSFLLNALVEDIQTKKGNRKAELELAFKIKGMFKEVQNEIMTAGGVVILPAKDRIIELPSQVMEAYGMEYYKE
jgi:hypothetical protein